MSSTKYVIFGQWENKDYNPGLWFVTPIWLLIWNHWTEFNLAWRKQYLTILYQDCVVNADRKTKMAASHFDWLRHFLLLLWNGWTEFYKIWQEAFNLKYVYLGLIGKPRRPPWSLIGWDIFDFSSENGKRNSTKLDRKQDLNVLYQLCVLDQDSPPGLWFVAYFDFFSETTERNSTKRDRKEDTNVLYQLCVLIGLIEKRKLPAGLWCAETSKTPKQNAKKLDGKQDKNVQHQHWFFWPMGNPN